MVNKTITYLSRRFFSRKVVPYWVVLILDCSSIACGILSAAYLEHGFGWMVGNRWELLWGFFLIMMFFILSFRLFHTYAEVVRYSSIVDLKNVVAATLTASVLIGVVSLIFKLADSTGVAMPGLFGTFLLFVISTMLMLIIRIGVNIVYDTIRTNAKTQKVFIYGVKSGAIAIARSIQSDDPARYTLAGFVNPDSMLESKYLMGVKVRIDGPHLIQKMQEAGATALLVSPLQTDYFRRQEKLVSGLIEAGIKIVMMPDPEEWDGHSDIFKAKLKEVGVEDLLPREKIEIDMDAIASQFSGKKILITGAAGSIGAEIVRQVALFHPSELILIDQAETPMHDIRRMMSSQFGEGCPDQTRRISCETIVASITDGVMMEMIFSAYSPEYVFHAAAYKHVPMMEDNPAIAVRNNVRGTRIIADLSVKYGVKKFVMISTDKAVSPTNVMGCSKRICEIYCQSLNKAVQDGKVAGVTQFVTTRFGNVLGSNGSVIPLFRDQIAKGGPITITHPDIVRYFMLIPEACRLVLEAGAMGHGGEIFVFDMGQPVKIVDMAKRMIALSGARDIKIKTIGLRDGEKLYEEVLADKEHTKSTNHPKIMVAAVREYDYDLACKNEDRLLEASYHMSSRDIVKLMAEIVPEYKTNNKHYL